MRVAQMVGELIYRGCSPKNTLLLVVLGRAVVLRRLRDAWLLSGREEALVRATAELDISIAR